MPGRTDNNFAFIFLFFVDELDMMFTVMDPAPPIQTGEHKTAIG
jgi:hypothetical protein